MSKFNSYAKRLNEAAKEAFEQYKKAEAGYQAAEQKRKDMPWNATAEEKTIMEARLIEARNALKDAQKAFYSGLEVMKGIRGELSKDLGKAYTASPNDIDPNTMELIKSGILTPAEYVSLANGAIKAGNHTMLRIIGSYADKVDKDHLSMEEKGALYGIVARARNSNGSEELGRYDVLMGVFERCARNPRLIDRWDELTEAEVANF